MTSTTALETGIRAADGHPLTDVELIQHRRKLRANALAGQICAAATVEAQSECELLELIGEFDATDAIRYWRDVKSLAHWLGWCCSMSPGIARERVRVARALRRMPTVLAAFREGRLSYSKVREITRVVDLVDESRLCALALQATASQLARTVAGFRAADGLRLPQQVKRRVTWTTREDGMLDVRARLPAEEGALLLAALRSAQDRFGTPAVPAPESSGAPDAAPESLDVADAAEGAVAAEAAAPPVESIREREARYGSADALLELARRFLDDGPDDASGEDRTLVVVHVAAELLAGAPVEPVAPGGPVVAGRGGAGGAAEVLDVPAGTSAQASLSAGTAAAPTCSVVGVGPIEPETARRLACDATVLGAVIDQHGDVLTLGRTRRLVSRAQRRALLVRDRMCQFPGCDQVRHLQAHHRIPWSAGGPTDLANLILLCRFHHTVVHEGGMTIEPAPPSDAGPAGPRWRFLMPDGTPHRPWYSREQLSFRLADQLRRAEAERQERRARIDRVDRFAHPEADTIRPGWRGERFDLAACVSAVFGMKRTDAFVVPEAA